MSDDEKPSWEWRNEVARLREQLATVTQERDAFKNQLRDISRGFDPIRIMTEGMTFVIELNQQLATVTQERDALLTRINSHEYMEKVRSTTSELQQSRLEP